MCGIAGFFEISRKIATGEGEACLKRMIAPLSHRGPDSWGIWTDAEAGIGLGHRRLAILDLSTAGHQPMHSKDGRFIITYNGEVYNFQTVRDELRALGHTFNGGSDTEVLLAAFVQWGVTTALRRFTGMFALAVWDRKTRTLLLARDRIGVKPLYWTKQDGRILFASELKGLMAHSSWHARLDRNAVAGFLCYSYVPAPHTVFEGVCKLTPGTVLTVKSDGAVSSEVYWDLRTAVQNGSRYPFEGDDANAADRLDAILREAVSKRMIADVPLGAFLSGGIDSSTVVALMQAQANRPVRTFTIGFNEEGYNEAEHAKAVARHLGTDHTELYVSADEARDVIPNLPDWFDEPFADPSQIPTLLVSKMTRAHVTVSLSGDGGDELFSGYPRYFLTEGLWKRIGSVPASLRRAVGSFVGSIREPVLDRAARLLPDRLRPLNPGRKIHRAASLLGMEAGDALYGELACVWPAANRLVPSAQAPVRIELDASLIDDLPDFLARMQYYDTLTYLPDDIMVKVDRCSMAVALEAREPLLDHTLVEFVWTLPRRMKVRDGQSKWLLREVLARYVPRSLTERPKMGFSVPIGAWLRGPLKDWGEALLSTSHLSRGGILDAGEVRRLWEDHQTHRANRESVLWNILMFRSWQERYRH